MHLSILSKQAATLQRIRVLRYALPVALFVLASTFEVWEHWIKHVPMRMSPLGWLEVCIFGMVGPCVIFVTLTYVERLLQRLHQAHTDIALLNQDLEQKVIMRTTELQQANLRLRAVDQIKSDFVSLVSHELRAPLSTLNGGLEVALQHETQLPPKAQRVLHLLLDETARLTGFVQTILDVAHLEDGKLHLNYGPVAVKPLLRHAVDVVFGPDEMRVLWQVPADLPPVWVDEIYTEQAIRNLLCNAQKYTPPHSPIILAVTLDERRLCITITDYGPGIARDLQAQIFERFVCIPTGDGDRPRGWGLGLYFARTLLTAQNGALTLQSPIHTDPTMLGSRFVVKLPIAEEPLTDEPLADEADAAAEGADVKVAAALLLGVAAYQGSAYKQEGVEDGAPAIN